MSKYNNYQGGVHLDELLKALLPKTEEQKRKIWREAVFIADTNVLLNLYKYSLHTRDEIISILENISDRIWIPHQVALEFLHNRTIKKHENISSFNDHKKAIISARDLAIKEIESLNGIKKTFRRIDTDSLKKDIKTFFEQKIKEFEEQNASYKKLEEEDHILSKILNLYKADKIGLPYTAQELEDIYNEGKTRYDKEIPPGYKDLKEKEGQFKTYGDTEIKSEFGDLLVWKQILDYSKSEKKSVIFISDDNKVDWMIEIGGKKEVRKELLNEFSFVTGEEFLMYNSESFLHNSSKYLNTQLDNASLVEVREVLENDEETKNIVKLQQQDFPNEKLLNRPKPPKKIVRISAINDILQKIRLDILDLKGTIEYLKQLSKDELIMVVEQVRSVQEKIGSLWSEIFKIQQYSKSKNKDIDEMIVKLFTAQIEIKSLLSTIES